MFRLLKNNKGQGLTIQYALTFFFVIIIISGMTIYFKRTLQGRIRDATVYMAKTVHNVYQGNVYVQYEPYYVETHAERTTAADEIEDILPSFNLSSGVWAATDITTTTTQSISNQARPGLAD